MDPYVKIEMFDRAGDKAYRDRREADADRYWTVSEALRTNERMREERDRTCLVARAAAQAASDFEATPDIWCRGALALDQHGHAVEPNDPNAVQWCALGRTYYHMGDDPYRYDSVIDYTLDVEHVTCTNDEGGRRPAIHLLRKAAARVQRVLSC
jgi:hypothetical protein